MGRVRGESDVAYAAKIDRLIELVLSEQDIEKSDPASPSELARRVHLDTIGRIPTQKELSDFRDAFSAGQYDEILDDILNSPGAVSHAFNFWSDILRVKNGLGRGSAPAEAAYRFWLRDALKENLPYDEFVSQLVTATGQVWNNGAAGYYIRDQGMPLDNAANTARIFLGLRLECAQCHDHPFAEWTQVDFYKMAAFTYGMEAKRYDSPHRVSLRKRLRKSHEETIGIPGFPLLVSQAAADDWLKISNAGLALDRWGLSQSDYQQVAQRSIEHYREYTESKSALTLAVIQMFAPIKHIQSIDTGSTLKLPHDYQYDDASPFDPISPETIIGNVAVGDGVRPSADVYAEWLTAAENPRFKKIIVNRLWNRVFGRGIFEPIDDYTEYTHVSNPALLLALEDLFVEIGYDMRRFQKILFLTEAYRSRVFDGELAPGEPFYFQAPLLRRKSAEQMWDSLVYLAVGDVDEFFPRDAAALSDLAEAERIFDVFESYTEAEFFSVVDEMDEILQTSLPKEAVARRNIQEAQDRGDEAAIGQLTKKYRDMTRAKEEALRKVAYQADEKNAMKAGQPSPSMTMGSTAKQSVFRPPLPDAFPAPDGYDSDQRAAWDESQRRQLMVFAHLTRFMARASELESPARPGHFLNVFGQSDRRAIENASKQASVPQALMMKNGPVVKAVTSPYSHLARTIDFSATPEEIATLTFESILSRTPTDNELPIMMTLFTRDTRRSWRNLVHTLLNSRQFLFIQ